MRSMPYVIVDEEYIEAAQMTFVDFDPDFIAMITWQDFDYLFKAN